MDSTPQELSPYTATMVVGPAPISAIKDGLDVPYDCEFVISEVNADVKYHYETKDGQFKVMHSNTTTVGSNISTKAVGSNRRVDLTRDYKYPEGSAAERAALGTTREKEAPPPGGVKFLFTMAPGKKLGEEVVCEVKLTAQDAVKSGGVQVTMTAESVHYTGVVGKHISKDTRTVWASGQ